MDRSRAPVPAAIWVDIKLVEAQVSQAIQNIRCRNPLPTGHTTTLGRAAATPKHPACNRCIQHRTSDAAHHALNDTSACASRAKPAGFTRFDIPALGKLATDANT